MTTFAHSSAGAMFGGSCEGGCSSSAAALDDAAAAAAAGASSSVAEVGCDPERTVQLPSGFYRGAPSPSARLLRASYSITSW